MDLITTKIILGTIGGFILGYFFRGARSFKLMKRIAEAIQEETKGFKSTLDNLQAQGDITKKITIELQDHVQKILTKQSKVKELKDEIEMTKRNLTKIKAEQEEYEEDYKERTGKHFNYRSKKDTNKDNGPNNHRGM